jgi:xylulokinase
VEIVAAEEGAAFGAAILAGVGAQAWPTVGAAARAVVRVAERVPPDAQSAGIMSSAYSAYRRVYPATKAIYA